MVECETGEELLHGVCIPRFIVKRLSPYGIKQLRKFSFDYQHTFDDIDIIIINFGTGQVSVVKR